MDYAIVGGDARFTCLTRLLCSQGADARLIDGTECGYAVPRTELGAVCEARSVVMNWPCKHAEEIMSCVCSGTRIFCCGSGTPERIPRRLECIDLWKDERLQLENAWLTAEGAICAAMNRMNRSLRDCHCMVIGWGRIGRALTEMLIGMGAQVTVASRYEKGRNCAIERGAESVSTYDIAHAISGKQMIFSTPPKLVLGLEELGSADQDALIIDLASAPYGVDLDAAEKLSLQAWREPGLPGRHCPFSAASALLKAIRRAERREEN